MIHRVVYRAGYDNCVYNTRGFEKGQQTFVERTNNNKIAWCVLFLRTILSKVFSRVTPNAFDIPLNLRILYS